jgi:hypothetical protein
VAYGADIDVDLERNPCEIRISGPIKQGDLKTLTSKLPSGYRVGKAGPTVCLNSDGGDFVEALDIAHFIADGYSTYLAPEAICVSACAWMFMAGTNYSTGGSNLSRLMNANSTLGFQGQRLDPAAVQQLGPEKAAENYNQAVRRLLTLAKQHTTSDIRPLIETSLIAEALGRTGRDFLFIDTVGKALRWNIDIENTNHVIPRSRDDLIMMCRNALAYANQFWDDDFLYKSMVADYIAYYDKSAREITAQILLAEGGSNACEVKVGFDNNLSEISGYTDITANLPLERSISATWFKVTRDPIRVHLPTLAMLNPNLHLSALPTQRSGRATSVASLATITSPAWCTQQAQKNLDEATICGSATLSAFEVYMDRYFNEIIGSRHQTSEQKTTIRSEQRLWLEMRKSCKENYDCLENAYRRRIRDLANALQSIPN